MLYAGGNFSSPASNVAKWNGSAWSPLGTGVNGEAFSLAIIDGVLYVGGVFTSAGGLDIADRLAVWNGSSWTHAPINLPGAAWIFGISKIDETLYLGYETAGTAYGSAITNINNTSTAPAYPIIVVDRTGGTTARLEYLRNETTRQTLYFNYALIDGEALTIDLSPQAKTVTSNYFGNVIGRALLPNSDLAAFALQPGENVISLYVHQDGGPTVNADLTFTPTHWSTDGGAAP